MNNTADGHELIVGNKYFFIIFNQNCSHCGYIDRAIECTLISAELCGSVCSSGPSSIWYQFKPLDGVDVTGWIDGNINEGEATKTIIKNLSCLEEFVLKKVV